MGASNKYGLSSKEFEAVQQIRQEIQKLSMLVIDFQMDQDQFKRQQQSYKQKILMAKKFNDQPEVRQYTNSLTNIKNDLKQAYYKREGWKSHIRLLQTTEKEYIAIGIMSKNNQRSQKMLALNEKKLIILGKIQEYRDHAMDMNYIRQQFNKAKQQAGISNDIAGNLIFQQSQMNLFPKGNNVYKQPIQSVIDFQKPQKYVQTARNDRRFKIEYRIISEQARRQYNSQRYRVGIQPDDRILYIKNPQLNINELFLYNWSSVGQLILTGCKINDKGWRNFIQSSSIFLKLKILEIYNNQIETIQRGDLQSFDKIRLVRFYLDKNGQKLTNPLNLESKKVLMRYTMKRKSVRVDFDNSKSCCDRIFSGSK